MARTSTKSTLDKFQQVANACGGILSDIAANYGVDRSTIYNWCKENDDFAQALEDSRERFVDLAESNLRKLVAGVPDVVVDEDGNKQFAGWREKPSEVAILFTLKTRGKKRGYTERDDSSSNASDLPTEVNVRITYNQKSDLDLQTKFEKPSQ